MVYGNLYPKGLMLPKKQIALAFAILYTIYIIARTCDL